ncbi:hypothetical protein HA399_07105 [Cobetia sp. UIB-001]|uniref:hypothetical protein n=1 Tax=Cobetia sp. UIB-001 TaxID=2717697 RepID=UPI00384CEB72
MNNAQIVVLLCIAAFLVIVIAEDREVVAALEANNKSKIEAGYKKDSVGYTKEQILRRNPLPIAPNALCLSMNEYRKINNTNGWSFKGGGWGCESDYYNLSESRYNLPDNIAYYVMGESEKSSAYYATIMINVNEFNNISNRLEDWSEAVDFWSYSNLEQHYILAKDFLPSRAGDNETVIGFVNGSRILAKSKYELWKNRNGATLVTRFYRIN